MQAYAISSILIVLPLVWGAYKLSELEIDISGDYKIFTKEDMAKFDGSNVSIQPPPSPRPSIWWHARMHGPLARSISSQSIVVIDCCHIRKIEGCAMCMHRECWECFPCRQVSDPDMHHDTCVMLMPGCMLGSLTSGFLWSRWRGKHSRHMRNPQFYISGASSTKGISIKFAIRSKLIWSTCSSLKYAQPITNKFCTCHDMCKILLWSVEYILYQSTANFGRISNSIEIS